MELASQIQQDSGYIRSPRGQQIIMQMANVGETGLNTLAKATQRHEREVNQFWRNWIRKCTYRNHMQEEVERNLLTLKLLTYEPMAAIVVAPTFSLPENIGGTHN